MKKALTSLFGLIPTNDIDVDGANEFMKGVMKGIVNEKSLLEIKGIIMEEATLNLLLKHPISLKTLVKKQD